jgi:hypothetical protein
VTAASSLTYHLVARTDDLSQPPVRAFREWLLAEMRAWLAEPTSSSRLRATQSSLRKNRLSGTRRRR